MVKSKISAGGVVQKVDIEDAGGMFEGNRASTWVSRGGKDCQYCKEDNLHGPF